MDFFSETTALKDRKERQESMSRMHWKERKCIREPFSFGKLMLAGTQWKHSTPKTDFESRASAFLPASAKSAKDFNTV